MKEEISRILAMVQDGKINSEEATELINAMKEKEAETEAVVVAPSKEGNTYLDKMLKIRVDSDGGDKVKVNLPLRLIQVGLKSGLSIATKIPESAKYVQDIDAIDIDMLTKAIENELEGEIVNIETADGEKVLVVIE